jgi:hypothetical protein
VVRAGAAPVLAEAVGAVATSGARARRCATAGDRSMNSMPDRVRVVAVARLSGVARHVAAVALSEGGGEGEQQREEQRD